MSKQRRRFLRCAACDDEFSVSFNRPIDFMPCPSCGALALISIDNHDLTVEDAEEIRE
jgi:rRNA maturation endonuclease Nob1